MGAFANQLRLLVRTQGIKQGWLANRLGVSRTAITQALAGKTRIRSDRLEKLLTALRIPEGEKRRLRWLYIADFAPERYRDMAAAVPRILEAMRSAADGARALLAAESAFDEIGEGAAGGKRALMRVLLDTLAGKALMARKTKQQLLAKLSKARSDLAFARLAGELAVEIVASVLAPGDPTALEKVRTVLAKESVENMVEVARQVVLEQSAKGKARR